MKKLLAIVGIAAFSSCSDDNDVSKTHDLTGKWNLINVTCECAPVDFEIGEHVWAFDLAKEKLTVENVVDEPLQILETGFYDIEVSNSKITILTVAYDYYFEDDKLFLADRPEVDGPLMEFVRDP